MGIFFLGGFMVFIKKRKGYMGWVFGSEKDENVKWKGEKDWMKTWTLGGLKRKKKVNLASKVSNKKGIL